MISTFNKLKKRQLTDPNIAFTTGLITDIIVGIFTVIAGYLLYRTILYKRSGEIRESDRIPVREDFTPLKIGRLANMSSTDSEASTETGEMRPGRLRAFLTVEKAVSHMKHPTNSGTTSLDSTSRRSSDPWGKRLSGLLGDDESLYDHVDLYYHDPKSTSSVWTKVKRDPDGPRSPSKSDEEPLSPEPCSSPAAFDGGLGVYGQRLLTKLKSRFEVKPIRIYSQPPPELAEGNNGAAMAFAGSIMAACVGGTVMSRCPVEVTPDQGMPVSWMHLSPADDSCGLSPTSTLAS